MLVVCAFAFGPYVGEEAKQWPNLTILITRMNPDLAMDTADQKLLKSTGAGNLFMVFGEPDLELRTLPDGKLQVELRGLDVYDPTTGEIRSDTTDEIACWFIDTDYNEESFFVRHAYFTGADEPYKKLQRALRAEIDEAAWSTLYSTVSRPFDPPSTGKIAVKVINHYGDEVLKVYDTGGPALEPVAGVCSWEGAMLVATFGPTTGWQGKTITLEDDQLVLEGHGPVKPGDVVVYDVQGHLLWASKGLRQLVYELAAEEPFVVQSEVAVPTMAPVDENLSSGANETARQRMSPALTRQPPARSQSVSPRSVRPPLVPARQSHTKTEDSFSMESRRSRPRKSWNRPPRAA